jgi:hypothetical protein
LAICCWLCYCHVLLHPSLLSSPSPARSPLLLFYPSYHSPTFFHPPTGCESERVSLVPASRGKGKKTLWAKLTHDLANGYILGAGTGAAHETDKDVIDRGVMFSSTYTIYDVREVDGIQLLRLRNPPGDHAEWNGDWSDGRWVGGWA